MGELTINEKRKIIRREFKQFNRENGFRFVKPNTLLRERNDILQYLQFKIKAGYISCEIASQPLYIPASVFSLNHRNSVLRQENKIEVGSLRQD